MWNAQSSEPQPFLYEELGPTPSVVPFSWHIPFVLLLSWFGGKQKGKLAKTSSKSSFLSISETWIIPICSSLAT